jgi:hypothetical protein
VPKPIPPTPIPPTLILDDVLGKGDAGDTLGYARDRGGDRQYDDWTAVAYGERRPPRHARRGRRPVDGGGAGGPSCRSPRQGLPPDGVIYDARLAIAGDPAASQAAELLSRRGEHRAIARVS